jgi:hypothetical protein
MDEVEEVRLCDVVNEIEAALVVNLLQDDGIPARSDATSGSSAFGGLPFESGHGVYVPSPLARRAREILSAYPHYHNLKNVHEPVSD